MPIFGERKVEKVFHIDHLPEQMRVVLKTVMDYSLSDVANLYGLTYLNPRLGEPIFIPYGYLTGKFGDFEEAYEHLLAEIEARKAEGYKKYAEWYPGYKPLDFFRLVFYSYTDRQEGVVYGIGAEPLALPPEPKVRLDGSLTKDAVALSPVFLPNALRGEVKFRDSLKPRWEEIKRAYLWLYRDFHLRFDKDKAHADDVAMFYMGKFFENLERVEREAREDQDATAEKAIVHVPKVKKVAKSVDLVEAIKEVYAEDLKIGRHFDVSLKDLIMSPKAVEAQVYNAMTFAREIVVVFEEKVDLDKCNYCPEILRNMKLVEDKGEVKVFRE
ncbi:MAG: hypothetical protein ACP5HQ_07590 [Thermoprotei archaeon]